MRRIFLSLLAALLFVGAVSGCNPKNDTPHESGTTNEERESGTDSSEPSPATLIDIVRDGVTDYTIVVAKSASSDSEVSDALTKLSKAFRTYMAVDPLQVSDAVYDGAVDAPLILVGDTSLRDDSDLELALRIGEYYVGMRGKQVVIYSKTNDQLARAVTYFANMVVAAEGKKGNDYLSLASDFSFTKKGDYTMDSITVCGTELYECKLVAASSDAVVTTLAREINYKLMQKYGHTLPIAESASGTALRILRGTAGSGWSIVTSADGVTITVDGLTSADAALTAFFETYIKSATSNKVCTLTAASSVSGTAADGAQDAAALQKSGDARVIFYNMNGHGNNANSEARRDIQLGFLADYDADVLCFQEFHPRSYLNGFSAGLEAMGYAKVDVDTNGGNNYTPIYYRADRYTVVDRGYRLYKGDNDANSKGLTWVLLRDKTSGKEFAVASTHFWWKGYDAADKVDFATHNATRVSNANELLDTVRSIKTKHGADTPIVFGGDLNALYASDPVNTVLSESGISLAWNVAKVKNNSGGHHGYATFDEDYGVFTAWGSPGTNQTYNGTWSIDHVFVSGKVTVERFHTLLDRYALIVSDHCPEIVDLSF